MSHIKALTFLIAEDNQDHAELIAEAILAFNEDNHIVQVSDGESAIKYLRGEFPYNDGQRLSPEIILLDLKMPRLDGLSTLKLIRKDAKFKHIPVVMVTTSNTQKEVLECYENGANSYLTKPLKFEDFSSKIKKLNSYWASTAELPLRS